MPESDQWNGDDELPNSQHGSVADDSEKIIKGETDDEADTEGVEDADK